MGPLEELSLYLDIKIRLDLKASALENILSLTGTSEGRELLLGAPGILRQLILLMQDKTSDVIAKEAALSLINISGDENGAGALLIISEASKIIDDNEMSDNLIKLCFKNIVNKNSKLADPCSMILSNMTRTSSFVERIIALIETNKLSLLDLLKAFTSNKYNSHGANLHYLGPVFSNLSQSKKIREFLMNRNQWVIQQLLPFVEYQDSILRRGGIVGTLKNCCFDEENHKWLLSTDVDILPYLLLPLAGPDEFSDEENDKLPIDLQYLPKTKQRESDGDIKTIILEALQQLCATRYGREYLRDKNTYLILRELHKNEQDKNVLLACENVVDILIRTEEEIGHENLKQIEVPIKYEETFKEMDNEYINSI